MKKKTIVYVDGYNLYYGLLKGTPFKWLDLLAFSKALLNSEHDVTAVRYFTSPVKTHPYDAAAIERQNVYLQALSTMPQITVKLGFYRKSPTSLPVCEPTCRTCSTPRNGLLRVIKMEEKRSDVNIAVSMMNDVFRAAADCYVLVTGDSDQVATVEAIRYDFGKPVLVFNPHVSYSQHLARAATYYRNISRDLSAGCQLPDRIPIGTKGHFLHRPSAW